MKFRTSVPILEQESKIDHTSKILLLGSCFVENIGEKLDYYQFQNLRNPFGIFYHPEAIGNFIKKVTENFPDYIIWALPVGLIYWADSVYEADYRAEWD